MLDRPVDRGNSGSYLEGYGDGFAEGYDEAFEVRTHEAMATIRALYRKLSDARATRDILGNLFLEYTSDMMVEHIMDLARENVARERDVRQLQEMVEILRDEIVRLQQTTYTQGVAQESVAAIDKMKAP